MNILFTHGYFLAEDPKERLIMRPYPPLGILYIAAYLEENGFKNTVFDSTFSELEKLKKHIRQTRPDVIGIYTNLMTKLNVLKIIRFIKAEATLSTKIVLGGPEVRNHKEKFLEHGADVNGSGIPPLYLAADVGNRAMVEFLLSHGAKVNGNSPQGPSPLHIAAETLRCDEKST